MLAMFSFAKILCGVNASSMSCGDGNFIKGARGIGRMNYHLPQLDAAEAMQAGMRSLRLSKSFPEICDVPPRRLDFSFQVKGADRKIEKHIQ